MGVPQREKGPYTIMFNHGHYYSVINYYYRERNILSNLFMCRQNYNSNKKYEDLITFMEQISITFMFSKIC